ncbi:MAG: hypothetical protein MI810_18025 [Flavobacteriales bacterium]|jgi:hypothetical protein|nr:hypothetical protein [Flavobacteriales bacterium]
MLLKKIILRNSEGFHAEMINWAGVQQIESEVFDGKDSLFDLIESLLVVHEDHNISKENRNMLDQVRGLGKPAHLVDINATLTATCASVKFWLENNKPNNVLIIGNDKLTQNSRLEEYLAKQAQVLSE